MNLKWLLASRDDSGAPTPRSMYESRGIGTRLELSKLEGRIQKDGHLGTLEFSRRGLYLGHNVQGGPRSRFKTFKTP
jgi:hypothetical protein